VSDGESVTVVREVQPEKAYLSKVVSDGGSVIVVRDLHWVKAASSIVVTDGGIVMVEITQLSKAWLPIAFKSDAMIMITVSRGAVLIPL